MHTISFYSFKGGVGRSLSVYYFAKVLAENGKKVVVADFDFEAPGMPYKLNVGLKEIKKGLVDYIHQFQEDYSIPETMADFLIPIPSIGYEGGTVHLFPAGASATNDYWLKLNQLDWKQLLFKPESYGQAFFLEWKLRLEKEIAPDVLLIDSRTGINDLTVVTLNLLADQVVVLGANNRENIEGSRMAMSAIMDGPDLGLGKAKPKLHFVLTRVPEAGEEFNGSRRRDLVNEVGIQLNRERGLASGKLVSKVYVVHSDSRLLWDERRLITDPREYLWDIERDYYRIFSKVFENTDVFKIDQIKEINKKSGIGEDLFNAFKKKDFRQAIEFVTKGNFEEWRKCYFKGLIHKEMGDHVDAVNCFNEALKLESDHIPSLFWRANSLVEMEKFDEALIEIDGLLQKKPDQSEFYNLKGIALSGLVLNTKALESYNKAIELDPNEGVYYYNRGIENEIVGNFDQSIKDLGKAIELEPDNANSYHQRGGILLRMGLLPEAISDLTFATELKSDLFDAQVDLSKAMLEQGRYKEALMVANRAIHNMKDPTSGLVVRGQIWMGLDDLVNAASDFRKALEFDRDNLEAWEYLLEIYLQIKDYENAKDCLSELRRINESFG